MNDFEDRAYVKRLPDAYDKRPESNNNKLLQINEVAVKALYADISEVVGMLDLDNAFGEILDDYGEMFGLYRGTLNDKQYRAVIKANIAANISKSDHMSVMRGLDYIFGKGNMQISEVTDSIATVRLKDMPYENLLETGLNADQIKELTKKLIAIGVQIEASYFWGTFEFGSIPEEYDECKGWGNIEQTIGGYLGTVVSGTTDIRTRKPLISVVPPNTRITYNQPAKVSLLSYTHNARIYYTTDGTDPTDQSVLYTEPFILYAGDYKGVSKTVKAIAYSDKLPPSIISEHVIAWKPALVGTFEFSSTNPVYDANKGFGNIEQSIGGYVGDVIDINV